MVVKVEDCRGDGGGVAIGFDGWSFWVSMTMSLWLGFLGFQENNIMDGYT